MEKKAFQRHTRLMNFLVIGVMSMVLAAALILLEWFLLELFQGEKLSAVQQDGLILPHWFLMAFGWGFAGLAAVCLYFASDSDWRYEVNQSLQAIGRDGGLDENGKQYLYSQEENLLDGLEPLMNRFFFLRKLVSLRWNIRHAASQHRFILPAGNRYVALFCLVPLLVTTLLFGGQILKADQQQTAAANAVKAGLEDLAQRAQPYFGNITLEKGRTQTGIDDLEKMHFYGSLSREFSPAGARVSVDFNRLGQLNRLCFVMNLDPSLSQQENLDALSSQLSLLHGLVMDSGFPLAIEQFRDMGVLPEEFCREFLKGDCYTPVQWKADGPSPSFWMTEEEPGVPSQVFVSLMVLEIN